MILEEVGGNKRIYYHVEQKYSVINIVKHHTRSSVDKLFGEVFLPEGYPTSVSKDYLQYQIWDTLQGSKQALCSSVTGVLSTRAILAGVGVGNRSASVSSATIQWVVRDGTGMLGRIIFAWKQGTDLDCNAKTWRLIADVLNDIGMILEMISPLFPDYFLLIACAGTISKSITGVAGGCTRAALTQHFARRDNLGDVSAKDGSQETAVGLIGMLLGMIVTTLLSNETTMGKGTWLFFIIFTILHLFCNYKGVSSVQLETFNRQRANIFLQHFLVSGKVLTPTECNYKREKPFILGVRILCTTVQEILQLIHVSKHEKVIWFDNNKSIMLGAQVQHAVGTNSNLLQNVMKKYDFGRSGKYFLTIQNLKIVIVLRHDALPETILRAYFQALYARYLKQRTPSLSCDEMIDHSLQFIAKHFGQHGGLQEKMEAKGIIQAK